jgi:succinate dehydrogenase / fumarate reductase, membrane anchor subunit
MSGKNYRTPLSRVRSLGSAHSGTMHFWRQRLTSVALIPLTIAFTFIVMALLGRNHDDALQIIGSPLIAIILLLFIGTTVYHMWLGMQVIIEDYVHDELPKILLLMGNTFFCITVALACVYAILQISLGV